MPKLSEWIEIYHQEMTVIAVATLSHDEAVKSQVAAAVEAFFSGLRDVSISGDFIPLQGILRNWVQLRVPTTGGTSSLFPLLATLKQVIWEHILQHTEVERAVPLILESDAIFTKANILLSEAENEALLAEMRDKLHVAQTRLKHLDKNKSNFIAVAAHELRTPLTLVEGYIDMMAGSIAVAIDPQHHILIDGVKGGTKRLREIINDIIDISLLDLNIMEFHYQPVWLRQVISAAERNVTKMFGSRHVTINVNITSIPTDPTYADPDRLLQAVQKVLANAVKYTPDGKTIEIMGRLLPGFVDIVITDNGVGIDSSNIPHIFDTFSAIGDASLHSSGKTKFKGGGPGLGLPIAKGILEAFGGTIWAESDGYDELNCPGSTFHIMVPMHDSPPFDNEHTGYQN